jgi:DNA modification methylase
MDTLKRMPDNFIDCVITSPPYWQKRQYDIEFDAIWDGDDNCEHEFGNDIKTKKSGGKGHKQDTSKGSWFENTSNVCVKCGAWKGQLGLEPNYKDYLRHLQHIMNEIQRVLKPTGTVWINLGDTYSSTSKGSGGVCVLKGAGKSMTEGRYYNAKVETDIQDKCLMLIPHRFAIDCIDNGWTVRNDIIWASTNKMPESVTDRFSVKKEYMFFMVKSKKYFFDLDKVREKHLYSNDSNDRQNRWSEKYVGLNQGERKQKGKYKDTEHESIHRQGMHKERGSNIVEKRPNLPDKKTFIDTLRKHFKVDSIVEKTKLPKTKVEHWFRYDVCFAYPTADDWKLLETDLFYKELVEDVVYETDDINKNADKGKNCGDVAEFWEKKPYSIVDAEFRKEVIYYRELPDHNELREYLQSARKRVNITIEEIESVFGGYKAHHWFEKNGSYPDKDDWTKLKGILKFDDKYDLVMTTEYLKSGLKQNNPKGKNCGDVMEFWDDGTSDFWDLPTQPSKEEHYASYNTSLLRKPLLAGCPEGGIVYDPFVGTGSTAEAAVRSGRKYIGSELSKKYVDIAEKRLLFFKTQTTLFDFINCE